VQLLAHAPKYLSRTRFNLNPLGPTAERLVRCIFGVWTGVVELQVPQQSTAACQCKLSPSRRTPHVWPSSWHLRRPPLSRPGLHAEGFA
jgi:hypothetical protein